MIDGELVEGTAGGVSSAAPGSTKAEEFNRARERLVAIEDALTALASRSSRRGETERYTLDEIQAALESADVGGWTPGTFHIWWPRFCAALGVRHISMAKTSQRGGRDR